ncbi:MAG: [FeFe] hydrogenase H-cluster maturation GTPase HydF [Candidatus Weimeria sp.]
MGLNDTPNGERIQIGIFGRRNAGKSSLLNLITGQPMAVVSDVKGTTTDPVSKSMELLPIGPVTFIDTPGMDDYGELGQKRVDQARKVLRRTDVAVLVVGADGYEFRAEKEFLAELKKRAVPYLIVANKADLLGDANRHQVISDLADALGEDPEKILLISTVDNPKDNGNLIRNQIAKLANEHVDERKLISDLLKPDDLVVLVIPVDFAAPKGRLILPQQQVIRDVLDAKGRVAMAQVTELASLLDSFKKPPRLVITDSQAFKEVARIVPESVPLTSFSILMSRYKGDLPLQTRGAREIEKLNGGEKILICEGCTHHRQCGDIGTQKLPKWIREKTGKDFEFEFTSGGDFPDDLSPYSLIIHCGGCMLPVREIRHRLDMAKASGVPVTNYGVMIAYLNGILERVLTPFQSEEVTRG